MACRARSARGLTLVEVVVVIAIILVLAAITFAVANQGKQNAKFTQCQSNLKQIGTAVGLYLADNQEAWPATVNEFERLDPRNSFGRRADQSPSNFPTPAEALHRYLKNTEVFRCPEDQGTSFAFVGELKPLHAKNGGSSYLFANLTNGENPSTWVRPEAQAYASDSANWWHRPEAKTTELEIKPGLVSLLYYDLHVGTGKFEGVQTRDTERDKPE